ncbi:gene transfer agent family protein [Brucella intermedia]|uniref:gene transfer agent family protein n=1 Tax=Brucella intermedia TaxID=94625 RepID=UPI0024470F5D|nr:gene transfer agent family protein [Brucella intermedia]WGG61864.1 gene transfer agent family protein [Brucella intermedia]
MSRNATVELDFGPGLQRFRLAWGQLSSLQEACDAGPYVILERIMNGTWKMNDIRETIRYGLIGGGMTPSEALKLVREYVEDRPPVESLMVAQAVLSAGLVGAPEEAVGEQDAANQTNQSTVSPTEKSDLPPSTEQEPQ